VKKRGEVILVSKLRRLKRIMALGGKKGKILLLRKGGGELTNKACQGVRYLRKRNKRRSRCGCGEMGLLVKKKGERNSNFAKKREQSRTKKKEGRAIL